MFAILYEDGSWFTSKDGAYWQAPRYGVQVVLQDDDNVGVEIVRAKRADSEDGWWIWKDGMWFGTNREGADAYRLMHHHPEHCTLQGTWLRHDRWQEALQEAEHRKAAWYPHERRVADG